MFALVGHDHRQLQRVQSALPAIECVVAADNLRTLHPADLDAECLIVVGGGLPGEDVGARLRALAQDFPLLPTVLVVPWEPSPTDAYGHSPIEVVGLAVVEHALLPAVNRAHCRVALGCLATTLERASAIPAQLRSALAYACRCEPPIRHVAELARATGCDRSSLWRAWHSALGEARHNTRPRLEDFLHWIVLLRAIIGKTPDLSWFAVSEELRVHHHTLSRLAKRLTSKSLRELHASGPLAILQLFTHNAVAIFTGVDGR